MTAEAGTSPRFVSTIRPWGVRISGANTNRDGTGTPGTDIWIVATGLDPASRLDMIHMHATGTTTAGMLRFFLSDASSLWLIHEEEVSAIVPSATVQAWSADWTPDSDLGPNRPLLYLAQNWILYVATHNNEEFDVTAPAGPGGF